MDSIAYEIDSFRKPADTNLYLYIWWRVRIVDSAQSAHFLFQRADAYEKIRQSEKTNLLLLQRSGVRLAVGSDGFEQTSVGEAEYLKELDVFDNRTLLKMWTENSAWTIFPGRKIGSLREGYEASFLVLESDPLQDFPT